MEWQGAVWPLLPLVGKSHSSLSLQVHEPSPAAEQSEEGAPSQSRGEEGVQVYLLLLGSHKRGILSWPDP